VTVIDSRGRFLGRWNLIDAAVVAAVVIVVVLGYGAFLLFRTPVPIVESITPTRIFAQQAGTLLVAGESFRPFLNARLDCGEREEACNSFVTPLLVPSPSRAEVKLTNLSPGTYDFVLLDEARELVRIPEAITVLPLATPAVAQMDLQAVGAFVFLSGADAAAIKAGVSLNEELGLAGGLIGVAGRPDTEGPAVRVLAVEPAEVGTQELRVGDGAVLDTPVTGKLQVPAILSLRCLVVTGGCTIGGVPVMKDALVPLAEWVPEDEQFERSVTHFIFRVDDLRAAEAPVTFVSADVELVDAVVRVKFLASPEVAKLPRAGHEDAAGLAVDEGVRQDGRNVRASMISVDAERRDVVATQELAQPGATDQVRIAFQDTMTMFEATLRVPVSLTAAGWQYAGRPVKVGARFEFEGPTYVMGGWVLDMQLGDETHTKN
jgi:hypothetical protein